MKTMTDHGLGFHDFTPPDVVQLGDGASLASVVQIVHHLCTCNLLHAIWTMALIVFNQSPTPSQVSKLVHWILGHLLVLQLPC